MEKFYCVFVCVWGKVGSQEDKDDIGTYVGPKVISDVSEK